jgi:RNA polymerase sigma factor (sigma-70 family)
MAPLMHQLRYAAFRPGAASLTDGQLLDLFLDHRSEEAFEALVRRHAPMVLGVCCRVLRNTHDAEDAFQAAFLVLVRKADSIVPRELVGHWLHGVAYRTAMKARSLAAQRRAKEQQVRDMPRPENQHEIWDDIRDRLDQELQRLPKKYQAPVILCDLEGKPRREVACALGLPEGTLSSRLNRARRLLARRLGGPGRTLSGGAMAIALAEQTASAAPASLVSSTLEAANKLAAGYAATAVVPAKVAALTEGVLKAMIFAKVKPLLTLLLAVSMVALGVGALSSWAEAYMMPLEPTTPSIIAQEDSEQKQKPAKPDKKGPKKTTIEERVKAEEVVAKSFRIRGATRLVVDTFNGPIQVTTGPAGAANVKVTKSVQALTKEAAEEELKNVEVEMTQEASAIHIRAKAKPQNNQTNRSAAVELQVPPGSALELNTSNGKVSVQGPTGKVGVATSNGRIEVKDTKVEGGSGVFDLNTSNGSIEVKATKATVAAHTSNGSIAFHGALAEGAHSFQTSNGNVSLHLPADANFSLDAQTSQGKVTSTFTLKPSDAKARNRTRVRGSIGDKPKITLKLRTSNGNIDVKPES